MSETIRFSRVTHPEFTTYYDVYLGKQLVGFVAKPEPHALWEGWPMGKVDGLIFGPDRGGVAELVVQRWRMTRS